jgi:hypothetical protein
MPASPITEGITTIHNNVDHFIYRNYQETHENGERLAIGTAVLWNQPLLMLRRVALIELLAEDATFRFMNEARHPGL